MKRTIISLLLVLALVLCFTLTATPAADAAALHPHDSATTQTHCGCGQAIGSAAITGHTHAADAVTWEAWPGNADVQEGHFYYLDKDYTTNELNYSSTKNFTLCLNGYSITQTSRITVRGTLNICDCASEPGTITVNYGNNSVHGGTATVYNGGTLNLFGGNLRNINTAGAKRGGGVYIEANSTFNMFGGTVSGGRATGSVRHGGNVYVVEGGYFNMYGGMLSGIADTSTAKYGANIYSQGTVTISGNAIIENGNATESGGLGGNIYVEKGIFTISGGTVSGGMAETNGGNVYVAADAQFNMSAGTLSGTEDTKTAVRGANIYSQGTVNISGNVTIENGKAEQGGNIYLDTGSLQITGGTIANGVASGNGGNIYSKVAMNIGDDITISGGSANQGGNVFLHQTGVLNLSGNAKIMNGIAPTGGNISVYNSETSVFKMTGGEVVGGNIHAGTNGTLVFQGGKVVDVAPTDEAVLWGNKTIFVEITKMSLEINDDNSLGLGYTVAIKAVGFEPVNSTNTGGYAYGLKLHAAGNLNQTQYSGYMVADDRFVADGAPNTYTAHLSNIMQTNLDAATNAARANEMVVGTAYMVIGEGTVVESQSTQSSLKDLCVSMYKRDNAAELDALEAVANYADVIADWKETAANLVTHSVTSPMVYPDYTFDHTPTTNELRQMAVKAMMDFLSVQWYTDETITYNKTGAAGGKTYIHVADTSYCGLPYTNGDKGLIQFLEYYDPTTGQLLFKGSNADFNNEIGGTCACGVMWSWSTVCDSLTGPFVNYNMVPQYGCIPVGSYTYENMDSITSYYTDLSTLTICQQNGTDVIFAAYAQTLPADGLTSSPSNHAMMIIEAPHVVYKADGSIDGDQSYLMIADQRGGPAGDGTFYELTVNGEVLRYSGRVSQKFTFNELYNLSYIPVTTAEFAGLDPYKAPEVTFDLDAYNTVEQIATGTIESNFPVCVLKINLVDANGNVAAALVSFQTDKNDVTSGLSRELPMSQFASVLQTNSMLKRMESGMNYTLMVDVTVSNGETFTVAQLPLSK